MIRSRGRAVVRRVGRLVVAVVRRARRVHPLAFFALLSLELVFAAASTAWPTHVPASSLVIPLLLGGMVLGFRQLVALTLVTLMIASFVLASRDQPTPTTGFLLVLGTIGWIVIAGAKVRNQLGVPGTRGESMLMELRDTLTAQGELPPLPAGWRAEVAIRSAGQSKFSGDFVVSTARDNVLEVALVDVSGKGVDAGTRALLLSGAFGGLLGVVPQEEFLSTCNAYLRRRELTEGFVTAVHLALDLTTGEYMVTSAGHPPAAHL